MAILRFNVFLGQLTVTDEDGMYTVAATSGRSECMNSTPSEWTEKQGPLPRGYYHLYVSEINNPGVLGDIARNLLGDWGDWRVPLHPQFCGGRSGFFLHGGRTLGSAGCIDIGGGVFGDTVSHRALASIQRSHMSELWVE